MSEASFPPIWTFLTLSRGPQEWPLRRLHPLPLLSCPLCGDWSYFPSKGEWKKSPCILQDLSFDDKWQCSQGAEHCTCLHPFMISHHGEQVTISASRIFLSPVGAFPKVRLWRNKSRVPCQSSFEFFCTCYSTPEC